MPTVFHFTGSILALELQQPNLRMTIQFNLIFILTFTDFVAERMAGITWQLPTALSFFHAKRHLGRERRRMAVFPGYACTGSGDISWTVLVFSQLVLGKKARAMRNTISDRRGHVKHPLLNETPIVFHFTGGILALELQQPNLRMTIQFNYSGFPKETPELKFWLHFFFSFSHSLQFFN